MSEHPQHAQHPQHSDDTFLDDVLAESPRTPPRHAADESSEQPGPSGPVLLSMRELRADGKRGPVFGPLDWELHAGQRGVLVGQQGSGRSALLLALAGRLKGTTGHLTVTQDGVQTDGVGHPRKLRQLTAVARISDLADLEPSLTVGEARDERALTEAIGVRRGRERFRELQDLLGERFDPEEVVEHLPAYRRTLLTAVLGCLRPSAYVVLDDLDASLTDQQTLWMHEQLDVLSAHGHTFIVSALDTTQVPAGGNILHLDAHDIPQNEES